MAETVTTDTADDVKFSDPKAQELWHRLLVVKKLIVEFEKGARDEETKRFVVDLKSAMNGDILEDENTGDLFRFEPGQGRLLTMLINAQNAQMDAELGGDESEESPR